MAHRSWLRYVAVVVVCVVALAAATVAGIGPFGQLFETWQLPLKDESIIRTQSAQKGLDPSLVAAIIYQESRFKDQTSRAGAKGLMQVLPQTAAFVAKQSGARTFETADLGRPDVNIAYGTWYLQYLLRHYDGNTQLAIAAYNAGEQNVDKWIRDAGGASSFSTDKVPFSETRDYVRRVIELRGEYRDRYGRQLAIAGSDTRS